jgi:hypothetical protein
VTPALLRVHVLIDSLSCGGAEPLLRDLAHGAPAHGLDLSVSHLYDGGAAARSLGLPVTTLHVMDTHATGRDRVRVRLAAAVRRRWHERVIAVSDHLREAYLAAAADRPGHALTIHNDELVARQSRARFEAEFTAESWAARLRALYEEVTV